MVMVTVTVTVTVTEVNSHSCSNGEMNPFLLRCLRNYIPGLFGRIKKVYRLVFVYVQSYIGTCLMSFPFFLYIWKENSPKK